MRNEPNNTRMASQVMNEPHLWPFLNLAPGESLDIDRIPEETGVDNPQTGEPYTPLGVVNDLAKFRHDFPFVPVIPFPNNVRTVALVQNVAKDIRVPDRCVAVMFFGSGNYYVSNNGNAETPTAAMDNDSGSVSSRSIYKPERFMFYTGGIQSFSVITPDAAGCIVTLIGYTPTEMPRYA